MQCNRKTHKGSYLVVPSLGDAFAGQLHAASIPFLAFNTWFVPAVETLVGVVILVRLMSRIGAFVLIGLMAVATYVHLVVDDPTLFPLQPELPILHFIVILLSFYLLVAGGGAWSKDLKNSHRNR
ncbi:MAG: DoxX family protein [Candidatus Zixiibacteriota bacterium]